MRSGRLLAEEAPRTLLQIYNCASLEEVFLKLSRQQGQYAQQPTELNISNNISLVNKKIEKKNIFPILTLIRVLFCKSYASFKINEFGTLHYVIKLNESNSITISIVQCNTCHFYNIIVYSNISQLSMSSLIYYI